MGKGGQMTTEGVTGDVVDLPKRLYDMAAGVYAHPKALLQRMVCGWCGLGV